MFTRSLINGDPDAACIHVTGELDIATAPQLGLTLRDAQAQARLVVLDLRDLAFIDSAGLHAIVHATSRARREGGRLVVLPAAASVERLFALTGTHEHLERGAATPAQTTLDAHHARSRRSSRVSAATDLREDDGPRTLRARVAAPFPWQGSSPASEPPIEPAKSLHGYADGRTGQVDGGRAE